MNIAVIVLMVLIAAWTFRKAVLRTRLRMDTEVRDVI